MSGRDEIPAFLRREKGSPAKHPRGRLPSLNEPLKLTRPNGFKRLTRAANAERAAINAEMMRICALADHGKVKK